MHTCTDHEEGAKPEYSCIQQRIHLIDVSLCLCGTQLMGGPLTLTGPN